jgi:hypothetical protein
VRSLYNFVVAPLGEMRYNNIKKVGDKELFLNTEIFNHQYINRRGTVLSVPKIGDTDIQVGDLVTLHHNVFRRWHDVKGREKNSRSFLEEGKYLVSLDQIFLYSRNEGWVCPDGYCFVQPLLKQTDSVNKIDTNTENQERPLIGIVKYSDGTVDVGDLVGFRPSSEFEFTVDGQRMYRVLSNFITIKYEYQGDEEEYNPSWAQSG